MCLDLLERVFRPTYRKRIESIDTAYDKFIYYTSATTGVEILKKQEIWMRSVSCMNDYREIEYGVSLFQMAFQDCNRRSRFEEILKICMGNDYTIERMMNELVIGREHLRNTVFITCVSEMEKRENADAYEKEDKLGRLSMWRAYGRDTGAALVLKSKSLLSDKFPGLNISPVEYLTREEFTRKIDEILENVEAHRPDLKKVPLDVLGSYFVETILFAIISIKHPGFEEEREWRIVFQVPQGQVPTFLKKDSVSIGGTPQTIYKIPLVGDVIAIPKLLDHIIIGPTDYPDTIKNVFIDELNNVGFVVDDKSVIASNIPLRP